MDEMPHKRDRGQVGIGTLIVFIAMVLVAAIAAGVLINTAGFLQSQSEETGEQSSAQVSDRLQVVNIAGPSIDGSTNEVTEVNLTVTKAPGADDVNLKAVTLQWVSDDAIVDLTHENSDETTNGEVFQTSAVQDDDGSITDGSNSESSVLNDNTDRAVLSLADLGGTVNGSTAANAGPLGEGQTATVTMTTQAGGETTATISVPESLEGKSAVAL